MKLNKFFANIWYNDIYKLCSVLYVEAAFENLLKAVVQEFEIPPNEASDKMLCNLDGTSLTKDSFEDYVCRSISEGKVPQFRVIPNVQQSDMGTNQSECKEDVEQQVLQKTDLRCRVRKLFSNLTKIQDNLNMAANKLKLYETEVGSNNRDELKVQRELGNRKAKREDVERQESEETDLRSIVSILFSNMTKIEYVNGLQGGQYKPWSENEI